LSVTEEVAGNFPGLGLKCTFGSTSQGFSPKTYYIRSVPLPVLLSKTLRFILFLSTDKQY
jgi:hypothetical protein